MDVLYKATMELYDNYFKMLEVALQNIPNSEMEKIARLNELVKEAEEALEADLAVFDKAIAEDSETLMGMKDELKIQNIYKKLQK